MKFLSIAFAIGIAPIGPLHAETPTEVAARYDLAGELLIARGDKVELHRAFGYIFPSAKHPHKVGETWRLASITKQVTAALLVRQHFDKLDTKIDQSNALSGLTLRDLLTHHTGLANPDDTLADKDAFPSFYRANAADLPYCQSRPATPGGAFSYNNCDYLMAVQLYGDRLRWPAGMVMAKPGQFGVPGFSKGRPEKEFNLATFGAAGGLLGTARAVLAFNRKLMNGSLLPGVARDALWTPEGNGSYQALGAWVFPGNLAGCPSSKRIIQRDGEIGGVQARNFILPDDGLSVIIFTNRSSDDFRFGEVWRQSGFAYDLLSAAACGTSSND